MYMNQEEKIELKKITRRLSAVLLLPVLLIASFFVLDPFHIIWKYDNYSYSPVVLNRDYVSTQYYLDHRDIYKYNSFILGNSKTLGFRATDWKKFLDAESHVYHFDASGEGLYGIEAKVRLIDRMGDSLKHVLVLLDESSLYYPEETGDGHIFIKHPVLSERPAYEFYLPFFKVYFQKFFFLKYLDMKIFGQYRPYMKGFLESRKVVYTENEGDLILEDIEHMAATNPDSFYTARASVFFPRNLEKEDTTGTFNGTAQKMKLISMRNIFRKQGTDVKIVIPPVYEPRRLHPDTRRMLDTIFGKENVYDYSGISEYSKDIHNFYESAHFRPNVGDSIMKEIYTLPGK